MSCHGVVQPRILGCTRTLWVATALQKSPLTPPGLTNSASGARRVTVPVHVPPQHSHERRAQQGAAR